MRQVAGVQNEIRRLRQGVDAAMASLSVPTTSVLMPALLKPICESLIWTKLKCRGCFSRLRCAAAAMSSRAMPPLTVQSIPGARPGHAFQEAAPVEAVLIVVALNEFWFFCFHVISCVILFRFTLSKTWAGQCYSAGNKIALGAVWTPMDEK